MSDNENSPEYGETDTSNLWILFLSLLLILLAASMLFLCRGTILFWHRFCVCRRGGCCCCVMDMEAYRRERESLQRLRELRRVQRMEQLRQRPTAQAAAVQNVSQANADTVEFHPIPLATFSQIPGPIPHSFSSSGRVLTPAELQPGMGVTQQMAYLNALGFILVPAHPGSAFNLEALQRGSSSNVDSFSSRANYSAEQRRAILERMLDFTTYHTPESQKDSETTTGETTEQNRDGQIQAEATFVEVDDNRKNDKTENTAERGGAYSSADLEAPMAANNNDEPTTFAFPLHEEPADIEKTCAICLDDFEEGELINNAFKCPHVFHRDCLLSWLDRHTVCPCCRRTMYTENEWLTAAATRESTRQAG